MQTRAAEPPRRTVLHVIDTLTYAGAQRYVVLLCQWSSRQHFRHIVCVLQPGTELKGTLESAGASVVCLNMPRPSILRPWRFARYGWRALRQIMRLCRQESVDVVQCHLSDAEFLGIAAAAFCQTSTIITTVHGPLPLLPERQWWSVRSMLRRFVTRILYCFVDHIVAVSDEVAAEARRLFKAPVAKMTTIINRIDTDSYGTPVDKRAVLLSLGLEPESRVITTVSRLEPHKGHACLLTALGLLEPQYNDVHLLLLGDGTARATLEDQCRRTGLVERVIFLGNRDDVGIILAATDIFAFPSFAEGTSLALMEAMAAGRPIVASDIPGNRALLTHKKNALLVPAGDAPALACAIECLFNDSSAAQALGRESRAFVREHFDIRTTVAELERLWLPRVD
jgi:glycosyltransferase involved in cell wall biosynthesis